MEIVNGEGTNGEGANGSPSLPSSPSPPPQSEVIELDVDTEQATHPKRSIISRPGFGSDGKHIPLLANHFKVSIKNPDEIFYQYSVSITSEDNRAIENKVLGRKILEKLYQTYSSELSGKRFAYDGEKGLYTVGPLPKNKTEFMVVLEDSYATGDSPAGDGIPGESAKRSKRSFQEKTFKVEISYAAKIPLKSVSLALEGAEPEKLQDALRSFFHDDSRNFSNIGGGVTACRGFHSSFRPTDGVLSLNMDVSTTMILTPGPVIDFLKSNQKARDARSIDWVKAKKLLKNMRIKTTHSKREFKITGMSEKPCNQLLFPMRVKKDDGTYDDQTVNITVFDYFTKHRNIEVTYSAYIPCIDVGKPDKPIYFPVELCSLVSLQRYTKALSTLQRASLLEKSRQKPQEKMRAITDVMLYHPFDLMYLVEGMKNYHYDDDPLLASCGICIEKQFAQVDGRVLETPKVKIGNGEEISPRNGRWNFNNKKLFSPIKIEKWAVVNFSAKCDASHLSRELINCGMNRGIIIDRPFSLTEEDPHNRKYGPVTRVEKIFEHIIQKLPGIPEFLLCILPERKNCPWKKKCLSDHGIPTQCICPVKINEQYLTNVLLKINTKLGGINSLLAIEESSRIPIINDTPTMIMGMDVSHGPAGQSDIPSIAAVVGSKSWPLISRYKASARSQPSKAEMISGLFQPQADGTDSGMMRLTSILVRLMFPNSRLYTKLFQANGPENVPSGTVVDNKVVHPRYYDFYMCAQPGMIGTSRPAHYHVLLDEIGFSPDALQNLILSLSYV
ncbi:argonaute 16-like protein [Tanacetum coccineum]